MGLIHSSAKRRQIINEDDGNLGILHEDLLMEILLRLSVKDVLRCRSVSQHWLALTTIPYFINKHVLHHHDDDLDISRIIFFSSIRPNPTRTVTVFSVVSENKTAILQLDFLLDHITSTTKIMRAQKVIGLSNGIVCFFLILKNKEEEADETEDEGDDDDDDDEDEDDVEEEEDEEEEKYQRVIVVWNPVTKQFKIIPKPDTDSNIPFKDQDEKDDIIHVSRRCSISLGFPCLGFDSVNHYNEHGIMIATEYRLFRVFAHKDSDNTTFRAQVFVQNTNSWEPVKNELKLSSLE